MNAFIFEKLFFNVLSNFSGEDWREECDFADKLLKFI